MSDQSLRILHLTAGSDAGGLSRYLFDLCSAMHARGHQITIAGERGAWHRMFENAPWPWIEVPLKGSPPALWKSARTLRRYLEDHPVDLFHTHYRRPTMVARRLQRIFGKPILYTVHLSDISLAWPRKMFTDFGDHTHVPSAAARRWVMDAGVSPDRVHLIPHGIDPARFPLADEPARQAARKSLGLSFSDTVAIYVGRLDDPKNEDWMVDLAGATCASLPNLRVLLLGEGPHEPTLRRRITSEGLKNRVQLLGHRDPLPIYQAADALLLPSSREGFSLVCAEAMSVGIPVLRTRTAGTEELIVENVTGRSCEINPAAFLSAATEFLSNPAALRPLGLSAARHIREHFTFDRQLDQTIQLYRSIKNS